MFKRNVNYIVKIQAWVRGTLTRKRVTQQLNKLNGHQAYMSGSKSKSLISFRSSSNLTEYDNAVRNMKE